MLFDLRGLRGEGERIAREYDAGAFDLADEDFRLVGPVGFTADVRKDARRVRLVGRVVAALETTCGRCLDPLRVPVDSTVDLLETGNFSVRSTICSTRIRHCRRERIRRTRHSSIRWAAHTGSACAPIFE
jgi:hypothetical protein